MSDLDFLWKVEEACLNARPSTREVLLGGQWLLRLEGGSTRRTNAVNPLRAASYDPRPILVAARALYRAHGQPCLFRVPTIASGLDAWLEDLQFVASGEVSTLVAQLGDLASPSDPAVDMQPAPGEPWLTAKFRLTPKVAATPDLYRAMAAAILLPKIFVCVSQHGRIVGVAYGAVHEGLLVVESVAVEETLRRRGHGRQLVGVLMAWGQRTGARAACLQVEADNLAALALYRSLGFATELYRYRYRSEPTYRPPDTVKIVPTA